MSERDKPTAIYVLWGKNLSDTVMQNKIVEENVM